MAAEKFQVDIVVSAKHHLLRAALKERGITQKGLARYLTEQTGKKVQPTTVNTWVCLRGYPRDEEVIAVLEAYLGYPAEKLFPDFIRNRAFLAANKVTEVVKGFSLIELAEKNLLPLPPSPLEAILTEERDRRLEKALSVLPEKKVIKWFFGIGCESLTLEEIGERLHVTRERARQIKERALRRLRDSTRSRQLRPFLDFNGMDERLSSCRHSLSEEAVGRKGDEGEISRLAFFDPDIAGEIRSSVGKV